MRIEANMLPTRGDPRPLAEHLLNRAMKFFEDEENLRAYEEWHKDMDKHMREWRERWEQKKAEAC